MQIAIATEVYRAVLYYADGGPAEDAVRFSSQRMNRQAAESLLASITGLPGFSGGHLEVHSGACGWCLADDDEEFDIVVQLGATEYSGRDPVQ